jgi:hypothetical protein
MSTHPTADEVPFKKVRRLSRSKFICGSMNNRKPPAKCKTDYADVLFARQFYGSVSTTELEGSGFLYLNLSVSTTMESAGSG